MFIKWLRESNIAAGILVLFRLYVGLYFLKAGFGKISGGAFDASGFLQNAIANPVAKGEQIVYPAYVSFLENIALPNVGLFNVLVPWGEFLIGLGLILGCLTTAAVFFMMVMNFSFMFAGTVSSNPLDILLGIFIITAGANAGKYGLDRWVLPFLRNKLSLKNSKEDKKIAAQA